MAGRDGEHGVDPHRVPPGSELPTNTGLGIPLTGDDYEALGIDPDQLEPGEQLRLLFVPADDPRFPDRQPPDQPGEPDQPEELSQAAQDRRRLADRLAQVLTDPPYRTLAHDAVAGLSVATPVEYVPEVQKALAEAPHVAEAPPPGAARVGSGTGGLVVRLHGPTWSLVFRVSPVPYPVLVCTDELAGHAWRIDQDPDWRPEIEHTMMAVVGQLSRYGIGGDRHQPPVPGDQDDQDHAG
ncbi:hypothetical protein KIF24_10965 [Micromonospora sp. Llam7]|uniref:hypothetical protein n=1 Tax=Micromonospora tarapacensis TaxID=2835305 RepID=UPI001C82CD9A|nr:hypothetical protein [Micromonospora tarapacensis]MBX7266500.1 hypothetical protein [Micromonospora tarapacensis]